jgi:aspartyl-tRNA(Asn)/glutamyl-tRNA(Gln) amidotransferase subunit C
MAVTKDDVRHIAKLAKLVFSEEELERLTRELASILDHIRMLEKAPLEGLEPVAHALDVVCPTREDSTKSSLPREEALQNAPEQEGGAFKVPEVIESE